MDYMFQSVSIMCDDRKDDKSVVDDLSCFIFEMHHSFVGAVCVKISLQKKIFFLNNNKILNNQN